VGTGPYTIEKYKEGEIAVLKARKDYWQKGADGKPLPYLDGMEFIDMGGDTGRPDRGSQVRRDAAHRQLGQPRPRHHEGGQGRSQCDRAPGSHRHHPGSAYAGRRQAL
jgi:hypothetical protein